MTTEPQRRDETKAQRRLRRRQEAFDKDPSNRSNSGVHRPGSVKKAAAEGKRARRERTGGAHLAKRNR